MAMPTSAWASAGASLMPSPAIATTRPCPCSRLMTSALSPGSTSASNSSMPSWRRDRLGSGAAVASQHHDAQSHVLQLLQSPSRRGGLDRVGDPKIPHTSPSMATRSRLHPPGALGAAGRATRRQRAPSSISSAHAADGTRLPSTIPDTPCRCSDRNARLAPSVKFRCFGRRHDGAPSGCSLLCSRLAANAITRSHPPRSPRPKPRVGFPSVSVPVLSTTRVSTFSRISSASAFLISTPASAPRPVPTMIAMGVASPSAQGQAMISTATALTSACAKRGCGPEQAPSHKGQRRDGNHHRHEPGSDAIGQALNRRAAALRLAHQLHDLRQQGFAADAFRAHDERTGAVDGCADHFAAWHPSRTGIDSPVIIDSSTELPPSSTTPSTGTFSPGRTRSRSPGLTWSSGHRLPLARHSSARRRAVFGLRSSKARMRGTGAAAGTQFENLAKQDESRDRGGSLEVDVRPSRPCRETRRERSEGNGRDQDCRRRPRRCPWRSA